MRFTNKHKLPTPMFLALARETYRRAGDISVTTLIKPPRIVQLSRRHADKIVADVSERAWSLFGSASHVILERGKSSRSIVEERLHAKVLGWELTGITDVYEEVETDPVWNVEANDYDEIPVKGSPSGILSDYKVTSIFKFLSEDRDEWAAQVNINAYLYRLAGYPVERVQIIVIIRDWQGSKAKYSQSYPQTSIQKIPIPLWSDDEILKVVKKRIKFHQEAEKKADDELPICTDAERWYSGDVWKVLKDGNKRADKRADTKAEAEEWIAQNAAKLPKNRFYLAPVQVKGEYRRCLDYCEVRGICKIGIKVRQEFLEEHTEGGVRELPLPDSGD